MATAPSVRSEEWCPRIISTRSVFDRFSDAAFDPKKARGRNAHPVTVISYMTWKIVTKAIRIIIGKTQYMNGVQHTIIGVAPERFHGTFIGYSFNFWVPTRCRRR